MTLYELFECEGICLGGSTLIIQSIDRNGNTTTHYEEDWFSDSLTWDAYTDDDGSEHYWYNAPITWIYQSGNNLVIEIDMED